MKTVVLLFSRDTTLIAAFTTRKYREWPASGGLTVVSRSTDDPAIVSGVLPFFEKWNWQGAAEVELKHDEKTGEDKVIEINPRFPAYLRFASRCGLELPAIAVRLASGEVSEPMHYPAYKVGATYLNPGLFIKSAVLQFREREVSTFPLAISDLRAGLPCVLDMLRDPLPFLGRAAEDFFGLTHQTSGVLNLSTSPSSAIDRQTA